MSKKPTYEELEQKVKTLKKEIVEITRIKKSQRKTEGHIIQRSPLPMDGLEFLRRIQDQGA